MNRRCRRSCTFPRRPRSAPGSRRCRGTPRRMSSPAASRGITARWCLPGRYPPPSRGSRTPRSTDRRRSCRGPTKRSRRLSPVQASAAPSFASPRRVELRAAATDESQRLERQSIVLTVPASFDEEARELTVQAARGRGARRRHAARGAARGALRVDRRAPTPADGDARRRRPRARLRRRRRDHRLQPDSRERRGRRTRVRTDCDRRAPAPRRRQPRSGACGPRRAEAARRVGEAVAQPAPGAPTQMQRGKGAAAGRVRSAESFRSRCSAAAAGSSAAARASRSRAKKSSARCWTGSFRSPRPPTCPLATRRAGLRELGLPFESEPAITRHLAAFLTRARTAPR